MNIIFLTHYFPPEVNAPASRTYDHCREWVKAGNRVTVITGVPSAPAGFVYDGYRNKIIQREIMDGIHIVRVWTFLSPNSGFIKRIINYISSMISTICYVLFSNFKFDLIVATSPQFFTGWAGVILKWLKRKPLILEIRDIWPESIVAVGAMKKSLLISILEKMELKMYKVSSHIVTVGKGYKANIINKGIDSDKISVITNGVLMYNDTISRKIDDLGRKGKQKFVCAYIGTVGMAHGLEVILRAASILYQNGDVSVEFWIVGDGAAKSSLEQKTVSLGLNNVRFFGRVPKSQIPEIISRSDAALVHLKKLELFASVIPSKIFEFMAYGIPIIMGVDGEARDIVVYYGSGCEMEPENSYDLLTAIETIKLNGREYYDSGKDVLEKYGREKLALQMLEILYKYVKI